jgi:hypothetical protein
MKTPNLLRRVVYCRIPHRSIFDVAPPGEVTVGAGFDTEKANTPMSSPRCALFKIMLGVC